VSLGWRTLRRAIGNSTRKAIGTLTHTLTEDPVVALTFDDSPHPESTPQALDILERFEAKATFFMVGEAAQRYPSLVRMIAEKGHVIGGHSYNHFSFARITGSERRRQMWACEQALAPYGQRLFRPPYGEQTLASRLDAFWLGYEVVCWSVDVGDWCESDASLMANHLEEQIRPGSIILLHDVIYDEGKPDPLRGPTLVIQAHCDRQAMFSAMEEMFRRIGNRFRFVTVPELLQHGSPYREFWFKRAPAP